MITCKLECTSRKYVSDKHSVDILTTVTPMIKWRVIKATCTIFTVAINITSELKIIYMQNTSSISNYGALYSKDVTRKKELTES